MILSSNTRNSQRKGEFAVCRLNNSLSSEIHVLILAKDRVNFLQSPG